MSQIKKFTILLLLMFILLVFRTCTALAAEEVDTSDVVDQKSIIEEQVTEMSYVINTNPYATTIQSLTQEEKELICKIAYREAGNQPIEGQRAVIEVILNRLNSEAWPNTVEAVLSAPGQFSTWKSRDKITDEKLLEMESVLYMVQIDSNTILPNNNYVYFNCVNPKKESIKIKEHWFWI